jgi:hypothetical protein
MRRLFWNSSMQNFFREKNVMKPIMNGFMEKAKKNKTNMFIVKLKLKIIIQMLLCSLLLVSQNLLLC